MRPLTALVSSVLAFVLALTVTFATAQRGDDLLLRSEKRWIETNPLEAYFQTHPDSKPESDITSTGLWRGYVASWEIADDRLLLTDVQVLRVKQGTDEFATEFYSIMSTVFPGQPRVLAEWFTGYLIAPSGKVVEYVHMGYASTYESYLVITVTSGVVTAERSMTEKEFRRFRKAQFRAFQKTEEYKRAFKALKKKGDTLSEIESVLFECEGARFMSIIFDKSLQR